MSRVIQQGMEQTIPLGSPGCGPMATMPKEVDQYVVINRIHLNEEQTEYLISRPH